MIARFRPRADRRDEFVALLTEVQAASRLDDGCVNYGYYTDVADPLAYIAVEEWRDMDALEAHLREPHVARLVSSIPDFAERAPEIAMHTVSVSGPLHRPG